MAWKKINTRAGRPASITVGFQQHGTLMRIPESCIKQAIGRSYSVKKTVLIAVSIDSRGKRLLLTPGHINYSPTLAVRRHQQQNMLKAYKSNPMSRQYYVSAGSILRELELLPVNVNGTEYRTRVASGNIVVAIGRGPINSSSTEV